MKGPYVIVLALAIGIAGLLSGGVYETVQPSAGRNDNTVYVVNRITGKTIYIVDGVRWDTSDGRK